MAPIFFTEDLSTGTQKYFQRAWVSNVGMEYLKKGHDLAKALAAAAPATAVGKKKSLPPRKAK